MPRNTGCSNANCTIRSSRSKSCSFLPNASNYLEGGLQRTFPGEIPASLLPLRESRNAQDRVHYMGRYSNRQDDYDVLGYQYCYGGEWIIWNWCNTSCRCREVYREIPFRHSYRRKTI
ncbi:hypothetical protein ILUMI_07936 [Ignelater luminosus]|uniref:Uncharacterized protein n=1 Tax=Ignelater luminosus TaxID=2038154 RepID=A0A8K0D5D9_IGNLU|nr:hypothetical protein ILUMI_07936 [Ignelater luminosus]